MRFYNNKGSLIVRTATALSAIALTIVTGCKSSPKEQTITMTQLQNLADKGQISDVHVYGPRPTTTPPPFKLFHQTDNSLTLVTDEHTTDDQISAILWQLHNAAKAHSFDTLHLPQAFIDKRDPIVWFHLYRGPKCASEKYASGKYPCGPSYHAAGDYTLGGFTDHNHDDAVLYTTSGTEQHLWQ